MVASTNLSLVARALRIHIAANTEIDEEHVLIGHPASVQLISGTDPHLSVYFYSIYPAANSGDIRPDGPLDTIAHCIMTPLAKSSGNPNQITQGEEDLRILGQVMTCMHGWRAMVVMDIDEKPVCRVEIIPLELTVDKLSKIIPVQPREGYHPSIAYELSLIPLFTNRPVSTESEVKVVTYGVSPDMNDELNESKHFPQKYIKAFVKAHENIASSDDWKPQLYLLDKTKRESLFKQIFTNQESEIFTLLIIGPSKKIALEEEELKVEIIAEFWAPGDEDFRICREEVVELGFPTSELENYHVTIEWELDTRLSGQYLFRIKRPNQASHGNVCLAVVARKGVL